MEKLIKLIFLFFLHPFFVIKQLKFCIIPNLAPIINRKIEFEGNYPKCDQLVRISGTGIVKIGNNCSLGYKPGGFHRGGLIEFQARYEDARIVIGNKVATNNNVFMCAANHIEIGDETLIGQYVTIMDFEAHGVDPMKRGQLGEIGKVIIGKNVWIGNNVTILKNVEIGNNSIIAAGAVVTGKFPSNVIIGGVPAKIIRNL